MLFSAVSLNLEMVSTLPSFVRAACTWQDDKNEERLKKDER
jgi:hypothetical protein